MWRGGMPLAKRWGKGGRGHARGLPARRALKGVPGHGGGIWQGKCGKAGRGFVGRGHRECKRLCGQYL